MLGDEVKMIAVAETQTSERAHIIEGIFPAWDVDVPRPTIFADEHIVNLAYVTEDQQVAVVTFDHCLEYKVGMPDENMINQHPLGNKGLSGYEAHWVETSSWLVELERCYQTISKNSFDGREYRHYIFTFNDRCFECIASGYSIEKFQHLSLVDALIASKDMLV